MAKFHYRESPTQKQKDVFKKYLSEDEESEKVPQMPSGGMPDY